MRILETDVLIREAEPGSWPDHFGQPRGTTATLRRRRPHVWMCRVRQRRRRPISAVYWRCQAGRRSHEDARSSPLMPSRH